MTTSFRPLVAALLIGTLGWAAGPALAQTPAPAPAAMADKATAPKPVRLHGSIAAIYKDHIDFVSRGGQKSVVALDAKTRYVQLKKTTLRHVKPGDFVGVGTMEQPDGSLKAVEMTIFAESARGTGEGNRPWDMPKSEMTNGTVGKVDSKSTKVLTVGYKGGEKTISVVKETTIVSQTVGDVKLLKKGSNVSINAIKGADGTFKALGINVGGVGPKGLVPPT